MKPKPESEEVVDGIAEDEELHSLTHYAGDEELLVKHMFAAIQHTKLEAMMPPVLKAIPLQDLQLLCIHELRGISKKRIIAIIQGRNMSDSSGSEDDEDEKEEQQLKQASKTASGRRRKASSKAKNSPDPSKPMDIVELEMRARLIQTMLKKDPKNKTIPPLDDIKAQIKSEPLSDRSYSSSRSVSRSRSYSSRSYSRSSSSRRSGSSSCSDSEGRRTKRKSGHRSRRRDRRGRRRKSYRDSSKKRDSSRDDSAATPDKNGSDSKRRQAKKTKISRKEFEDRMRRAKENRTYRKRTDSEDETKTGKKKDQSDDGEERSGAAGRLHERAKGSEEVADAEKEAVEDESEKEEGEIDSNEDEEAGAYYSDEGSPRRKKSRRSRSFSSISSLSGTDRSRSGRRSKRGQDKKRKRRKEHQKPVDKNLIHATLNEENSRSAAHSSKRSKSKTGIEAVDSEEDFDNLGNGNKREISRSDANVGLRTDRTNVSFSFNKKTAPSLMSGTDFEFGMSYSAPPPSRPPRTPPLSHSMKKSAAGDQIVISSDSECEEKPIKKARKNTAEKPTFIEDDVNDGAVNISDQNDLKLCEETVMKDIFDDMNDDEEEEEQSNEPTTRTDLTIKAEPTDHAENDGDGGSVDVNRSGSSPNITAGVSVKRELNSPEEMESVGSLSKREVETPIAQKATGEQDSEEGACSDEDSNSRGNMRAPRSFVNSFQSASDELAGSGTANRSYIPLGSGPDHKKSNGDVCNESDEEEEDVGLVDLPEDEHFALDVDDEDSNSQSKYDDTIDPVAEGGDDSEVTADKTDFYRGVENLNVSEDNSLSAPQESQMPVASEHKSESEEEGEIEEDAGLVELDPGDAEELSGIAASTPARARVRQGGTEIIGEIEPSSKDAAGLENLSESGSSWSSRWLQSEKVQKVVTNSKMLSRMRKRIKIDKINAKAGSSAAAVGETALESQKTEENAKDDATASSSASVPVINSMEEYKKLLGKADTASDGVAVTGGDAAAAGESEKKDGDDASSDDSDEDLWSKMMGN